MQTKIYTFIQKFEVSKFFFLKLYFPELQISLSEWFLKDHVTLKTGEMAAKDSALPSKE